jgi:UDP-2,3-diacylglucosamine pyrophosphatase LpxH
MHDKLLKRLLEVSHVYLLARLKDERIGYGYTDDLRIFIPDLHLISSDRDEVYNYTTNYQDLLKEVMQKIKDLKTDPDNSDKKIAVYQLGDFLDLWRQTPYYWSITEFTRRWEANVQKILDDKSSIIDLFRDPALKTNFLLGNHDFDLHNLASFVDWNLKYYFPIDEPSVFTFHGDIFSVFERKVPDWLQYLAVYVMGPLKKASKKYLGELRKETIRIYKGRKFTNYIQQKTPPALDHILEIQEEHLAMDHYLQEENFNVKKAGISEGESLRYLKESKELASMINEDLEWNLRTSVIAHTHYPRIAIDDRADHFFSLMDCGAWINKCRVIIGDEEKVVGNAQIGVLHNNDARVYQLLPKS